MNLLYFSLNFFIGTCLASHANVIYERSRKQDFIFSRSHCTNCYTTLSLLDEIPLFSYLFLKGRCKYCQEAIPSELFLFELIGGFTFCTIDFNNKNELILSLFLFSFLLVAIADYDQEEFDLFFLFPAFIIAVFFNKISLFNLTEWFYFLPIFTVLCWNVFKRKLGLGDLLIYILLSFYFTPLFANLTLLLASLLLLVVHLIERNKISTNYPFIPFIFIGTIISQFILGK